MAFIAFCFPVVLLRCLPFFGLFDFYRDVEPLSAAWSNNYWASVVPDVLLSLFRVFLGLSCQMPHINLARVWSARCRVCLSSTFITMLAGNLQRQPVSWGSPPPPCRASPQSHTVFSVCCIDTALPTLGELTNTAPFSLYDLNLYMSSSSA